MKNLFKIWTLLSVVSSVAFAADGAAVDSALKGSAADGVTRDSSGLVLQDLDYTDHMQTLPNYDRGFYYSQALHIKTSGTKPIEKPYGKLLHLRADIAEFSSQAWLTVDTTGGKRDTVRGKSQASVIYSKFDKDYVAKMLKAAEAAYAWAKKNPTAFYKQPADVQTGSYAPGDENGKDEFRFAAAELFSALTKSGDAAKAAPYLADLKANPFTPNGAWWGDMNMITAFRVPAFPWSWNWGSNSAMANNGIVLMHAYYLTGDRSYLDGAQQDFDLNGTEHWKCPNYAASDMPALAYLDDRCRLFTIVA